MIDFPAVNDSKLGRILHLWTILQSGHAPTADFLADTLACSRRTIFRDLDLLRDAGVDLQFDKALGGYIIPEEVKRGGLGLDFEELKALVLAAAASPIAQIAPFRQHVHLSIAKVMASSPKPVRTEANNLLRCFSFLGSQSTVPTDQKHIFESLVDAGARRERLRITLRLQDSPRRQNTTLSLYQLSQTPYGWLVTGRSTIHRSTRKFLLQEIEWAERAGDHYDIPAQYLRAKHEYDSSTPRTSEVKLSVYPEERHNVNQTGA